MLTDLDMSDICSAFYVHFCYIFVEYFLAELSGFDDSHYL